MRIFRGACRRKRLHKLLLQLLSLRRDIFEGPEKTTSQDHSAHNPYINEIAVIIRSPLLSSLFREFLENTHCLENFVFYLKVSSFIAHYEQRRHTSTCPEVNDDALEHLHSLYRTFIARGSPWEVNIDESIHSPLSALLGNAAEDRSKTIGNIDGIVSFLREAGSSIFELLATDSLPKFLSRPEYAAVFRGYNPHSTSVAPIS